MGVRLTNVQPNLAKLGEFQKWLFGMPYSFVIKDGERSGLLPDSFDPHTYQCTFLFGMTGKTSPSSLRNNLVC